MDFLQRFFSLLINDIFYFIKHSSLYNYADDNTLSFSSPDYDILISTLEAESQVLIDWFKDNKMQANPDKFQDVSPVTQNTVYFNLLFPVRKIRF
jgi:hypothetical protein